MVDTVCEVTVLSGSSAFIAALASCSGTTGDAAENTGCTFSAGGLLGETANSPGTVPPFLQRQN